MSRVPKPSPLLVIRGACQSLELAARAERGCTDADLAARRPAKRDARDWTAWFRYHTWLSRLLAGGVQNAPVGAERRAPDLDDAIVLDAYRSLPKVVRLTPDAAGARRTVTVYPKSAHVQIELHTRNLLLAQYTEAVAALQASTDPAAIDLVQRALREIDYQHQVAAWVLTTPGPGQPFADDADAPVPPETIRDLSSLELLAIDRAAQAVNARRLEALDALLAADPVDGVAPRRPSWSAFFASIAEDPADMWRLMRDRDLPNVYATVRLKNDGKLAAHQDAERAADARRDAA